MIYKDETLKQFKNSSRGKKVIVYWEPPSYNVLKMTWEDVSEIIGNIDSIIMGKEEQEASFTTDPINGISMIPINGKLVPQYPSLTSLFHHCQNLLLHAETKPECLLQEQRNQEASFQ